MEFNEIWNNIAPYVGTGSFLTGVGVIVGIVIKILQLLRDIKKNANFQSLFKQALPKDLTVSVAALTKTEVDKLTDNYIPGCRADYIKLTPHTVETVSQFFQQLHQ